MALTARDLAPADAAALAGLMRRIDADHPTGFCLGEPEARELMSGAESRFEGAFDGEHLVAFTAVMPGSPQSTGQRFILFGDVDPARLREGIGTLMLSRALEAARAVHRQVAPDLSATYAATALAGRADQAGLLTSAGFVPTGHSVMMVADLARPVAVPEAPRGLVASSFDPAAAEELRLAHNTAFGDHPDRTPMGPDFWELFMVRAAHNRHHLAAVARDEAGRVAGYVFAHEYTVPQSGGPGPELHVPYVGTLPHHRRRGVATWLLTRVLGLAREAGYATASLSVDTANPTGALGVYERAGFRHLYQQDSYELAEPLLP
ncbi:GNAT family N-acetyltransferase [Nocardioides sp. zg-1308]|uniref:GNAT family N-acetyltransferase n=1 Tax=Nocardioides sp. zg-1308 TaxID=2736253 RepID=UPI0015525AFF|nr:GNAT family N-acetyltransferase [Nocardioides sp. zg-1308]NPD07129.1 GNAT family N-acetyltransferase [Nocardioides sp. zg-1308]